MSYVARILDGIVVEVVQLPNGVALADAFHPDAGFVAAKASTKVGMTYADGEFGPIPEPEPEEAAPSSSANGPGSIGLDALNQMFEHGRQIQDDHQNALKSILDAMLGGGQGRR